MGEEIKEVGKEIRNLVKGKRENKGKAISSDLTKGRKEEEARVRCGEGRRERGGSEGICEVDEWEKEGKKEVRKWSRETGERRMGGREGN